jgi:hypothetical protein
MAWGLLLSSSVGKEGRAKSPGPKKKKLLAAAAEEEEEEEGQEVINHFFPFLSFISSISF